MRITIADGRSSFYQWDLNRKLCLEGVEPGTMVNFCRGDGTAYSVAAVQENGKVFANVPNAWLQNSGSYPVYIYFENTHTTCKCTMHIQARPKPDEYVYTETEVLNFHTLSVRMQELEDNLDEQVSSRIEAYLKENPPSGGVDFETDNTLTLKDGILSVNTTDQMEQDNTLPMTSAGVYATVGNIEALLKTI